MPNTYNTNSPEGMFFMKTLNLDDIFPYSKNFIKKYIANDISLSFKT